MQFIEEEKEAQQALQDPSVCVNPLAVDKRQELVRHLVDFMVKSFGLFPSAYQKRSTASAAIIVFPRLACENSAIGGIVRTYETNLFSANDSNELRFYFPFSGFVVERRHWMVECSFEKCSCCTKEIDKQTLCETFGKNEWSIRCC